MKLTDLSHHLRATMKRRALLSLVLAFAALHAGAATVNAAASWAQSYGAGNYDSAGKPGGVDQYSSGADVPRAIMQMPDGGFVVAGQMRLPRAYRNNAGGSIDGCLVRFAADGTILWQRMLHQPTDSSGRYPLTDISNAKADAQGNIFVIGAKGNLANSAQVPFVAKFSPAGDLIWENGLPKTKGKYEYQYQGNFVDYEAGTVPVGYMSLTNDGGVLMPLYQARPAGYATYGLAKFNADGSLGFYKVYEGSHQYPSVGPACQSLDGTRYAMAIAYATSSTPRVGPYNGTLLIVTDASGNVIGQHGYESLAFEQSETPIDIIATADGGFASLAARADARALMLRKFNVDGTAASLAKQIQANSGGGIFIGNSLAQMADGGFLIGGYTNTAGASAVDVALMKVQSTGALEFVSLVGGPGSEGSTTAYGVTGRAVAIRAADGGYAFASSTQSYYTGVAANKSDWWVVKTNASRRVAGFAGNMTDQSLSNYTSSGSVQSSTAYNALTAPQYTYQAVTSTLPPLILEDPATFMPPNRPTLQIQGSSPRILSSLKAEAIVNQHFSYHIIAGYFPAGATVVYSAAGLPDGFVYDTATGIISGIPRPGSETTNTPHLFTIAAYDGTDTVYATVALTIGEGAPELTVNGSSSPTPNLNDKVLTFAVAHSGKLAGRTMSIQATTGAPTDEAGWQDLPGATSLPYDPVSKRYLLSTTNYPLQGSVHFRARLAASAFAPNVSAPIGPFNLTSSKIHLGTPKLKLRTNTPNADFEFEATQAALVNGIQLRVQSTTTPADEATWTDLTNSTAGVMRASDTNPSVFLLLVNNLPPARGLYFRVVAAASGYTDGLSRPYGPMSLTADIPPTVSITLPGSGGDGSPENPRVVTVGQMNFTVTANVPAGRNLKDLWLQLDGKRLTPAFSGNGSTSVQYTTSAIDVGDHLIDAIAIDDLGGRARAGTTPVFLRVIPAATTANPATNGTASTAAANGKVYTAVAEGDWDSPATWKDRSGNAGVPGVNDSAIIGLRVFGYNRKHVQALTVTSGGILANGGFLSTKFTISVQKLATISGGRILGTDIEIPAGGVCNLTNKLDLEFSDGSAIYNNGGVLNVHGSGGLFGLENLVNIGQLNWKTPLYIHPRAALAASPRILKAANVRLDGALLGSTRVLPLGGASVITHDGGSVITHDGGSVITHDGGSLVAQGGGNVITHDGGSLISQDGGGLISQDGGGLISQDGGGLVASGAGNRPQGEASEIADGTTVAANIVVTGGDIDLTGISLTGAVALEGGVLRGAGLIKGSLTNTGGIIAPGNSAGTFAVTGDFAQSANGTLVMEAAGAEAGQFDRLQVGGTANLGGKLNVSRINGYVPLPNDPFNPLGYNAVSGSFTAASSNVQVTPNSTGVLATLDPNAPNPPLVLNSAVSRKTHNGLGPFDVNLPLSGNVGVESRRTNANGDHQIVLNFAEPVQSVGSVTLTSNSGSVTSVTTVGATVTVDLTGIGNEQIIAIGLTNVSNGAVTANFSVSMGVLLGDGNGDGTVNAGDALGTRARSGEATSATNYRYEVNTDGTVNGGDALLVRARSGNTIYP